MTWKRVGFGPGIFGFLVFLGLLEFLFVGGIFVLLFEGYCPGTDLRAKGYFLSACLSLRSNSRIRRLASCSARLCAARILARRSTMLCRYMIITPQTAKALTALLLRFAMPRREITSTAVPRAHCKLSIYRNRGLSRV